MVLKNVSSSVCLPDALGQTSSRLLQASRLLEGCPNLTWCEQDDSRPPLYEETTARRMEEGDSSEEDEDDQKEPPPEPTRFGWVQGVMVGTVCPLCVLTVV